MLTFDDLLNHYNYPNNNIRDKKCSKKRSKLYQIFYYNIKIFLKMKKYILKPETYKNY